VRGLGTLINTIAILVGGGVGLLFGDRIADRVRTTVVQVIGLVTLALGLRDALGTQNMMLPLVGMVIGAMIGELLNVEGRLDSVGRVLRNRFARPGTDYRFVEGFVTSTLLFCIGPLTILGAIEDASGRTPQLYMIKGTLDGFMTVIFTAVYGAGAIFAAVSVFVVQGTLTLFGSGIDSLLTDRMRLELFAAGGLAVMAIGINLLDIKKIRLGSLLPGLIVTPLLVWLFAVPGGILH